MDALLSQLKGQGSPSPSPKPNSNTDKNTDKLLDTIHLLSQATLLVAQQLQKRKQPAPTYLPTPLLTPKSSSVSSAKKTPPPKPQSSPTSSAKTPPLKPSAPMLSWVSRAPEYYRLPPPNSTIATPPSVPIPTKRTPHTKKDRKPKSKRTSTQPTPTTTPATPRAVQTDQREPPAPTNPTPSPSTTGQAQPDQREPLPLSTSRPAQTDRREPPNPLPTPTPSTPSSQTIPDSKAAAKAEKRASRRLASKEKHKSAATASTPTPTPTPPPIHQDDVAPMAPSNHVVNFPHTYDNCPRLPECPAHMVEFAVYSQAYAARTRDAPLPSFPDFPQPYAGPGFELRAERDTAWWPVPPSDNSSPPGTPADPNAFLFPPPDDDTHLT